MNKQEIVDYVMNTPHNINPAILNQKLDEMEVQPNWIQSDWNENDETSAAYIQNRPFYTENESVTVQEETTITLDEDGTGYYDGSWYPNIDVVYTVIWDGIEYISEPGYIDSDACYRFNVTIDGERVNFYEGQTIYGTPAMAGEHTFKILEIQETVHKVDLKYLPDIPTKMNVYNAVCKNSFSMSNTQATGKNSHAIGEYTTASGRKSHAEGDHTTASGDNSHAEGYYTTASGSSSHTEGDLTTASGGSSHAEGDHTTASGQYAHAEGHGTVAQRASQHVQGQFNILDTDGSVISNGKYLHIVGNGTGDTNRSNAHTLDWDGNAWFAGGIELTSPNGTRFRFTVNDAGQLSSTQIV